MRVRVKVRVKATVKGEKVPTCCVVGLTIVGLAIVSTGDAEGARLVRLRLRVQVRGEGQD